MADSVTRYSNIASVWTLIASIICGTMYIASLEKRLTIVEMKLDDMKVSLEKVMVVKNGKEIKNIS